MSTITKLANFRSARGVSVSNPCYIIMVSSDSNSVQIELSHKANAVSVDYNLFHFKANDMFN